MWPRTDHPRSRGEYCQIVPLTRGGPGSSPLSRGIHRTAQHPRGTMGIIPALAGNTDFPLTIESQEEDHPRSRGEYKVKRINDFAHEGSSPLSRGILAAGLRVVRPVGIIPALAGNTDKKPRPGGTWRDHPRSRGEYWPVTGAAMDPKGSSPLSRGIPPEEPKARHSLGIIPALAGNTWFRGTQESLWPDHPRSRGEYNETAQNRVNQKGSSPLSRGIPHHGAGHGRGSGIIPALAGNTPPGLDCGDLVEDHPRSRGEYESVDVERQWPEGSSPLSRGILCCPRVSNLRRGIIPALAGNTIPVAVIMVSIADHPRSRGEYLGGTVVETVTSRIIPALAGNTAGLTRP